MNHGKTVERQMADQHGVVTRRQALAAGMTPTQINRRVDSGSWLRLAAGVYASASSPASWNRRLSAALLSEPISLAGGLSAAHLHGFTGIGVTKPELLVPYGRNARSRLARIIRARHFDTVDTSTIEGFSCTSYAETILTLSMRFPSTLIERHVDYGLAAGKLNIADFDPILDRLAFARQRGLRSLRRVVAERSEKGYQPPTNELERLLYRLLEHPLVPPHDRQLPITYERMNATVDAYIPQWRMIVEADGRRWHTRKKDFERDRLRDNNAIAAGLVVVRFTWKMLKFEPSQCLNTLTKAGEQRLTASV